MWSPLFCCFSMRVWLFAVEGIHAFKCRCTQPPPRASSPSPGTGLLQTPSTSQRPNTIAPQCNSAGFPWKVLNPK